ncbi:hypothetical protein AAF712_016095 [Marasmius tenuissimus]|uniref:HMG box domain-containing protein n=1 Tax=Marasmius tenuissimus TaxID=585030 RepID=A0ABR2Z7M4_9AGAR
MPPIRASSTMLSGARFNPTGFQAQSPTSGDSLPPSDPMESSSMSTPSSSSPDKPIHSLNCFILFRTEFCKESNLRGESHPGAQLSKNAAVAWGELAPEEKKPWKDLANLKKRQRKLEQKCAGTARSLHKACKVRSAGMGSARDAGSSRNAEGLSVSYSATTSSESTSFRGVKDETTTSAWGTGVDMVTNVDVASDFAAESLSWSDLELHPLSVDIPPTSALSFLAPPPTSESVLPMSDETFLSYLSTLIYPTEESNHPFGLKPEIHPLEPRFDAVATTTNSLIGDLDESPGMSSKTQYDLGLGFELSDDLFAWLSPQ